MATRKKIEDLTPEEMLRLLVENVLRHIEFKGFRDEEGKEHMQATIQVNRNRTVLSHIITSKQASRDTFVFDLVVLEAYMKNKPARAKAIAHEIIKHRQGMADRNMK